MSNNEYQYCEQTDLCGFDRINGIRQSHNCEPPSVVHTNTKQRKYSKLITREFPLQNSKRILPARDDALTLIVQYDCTDKRNDVVSVKLKVYDKMSNTTSWHELSTDDVNTFVTLFVNLKRDIENQDCTSMLF